MNKNIKRLIRGNHKKNKILKSFLLFKTLKRIL